MNRLLLVFAGVFLLGGPVQAENPPPSSSAADPVVVAVQRVLPSVVNISTERLVTRGRVDPFEQIWREFFGGPPRGGRGGGQSLGSGVIVDENGWIVTNYHVVRRASKIHVVLSSGEEFEAQYVSGDDENDLALLKIEREQPLPAIDLATDRPLMLGETVIAVGNPFGLEHTVTKGVLSAMNRRYTAGDQQFNDILQTDASINPGNSGGPLINTEGRLIGINMAILAHGQGIGFAIPATRVANLLASWLTVEKRARLWLGLRFAVEANRIVIADVQPDSPAARAGCRVDDRVRQVDGQDYRNLLRLQRYLIRKQAGDAVRLDLERQDERHEIAVELVALPRVSAPDMMLEKFGLQVQALTADLAEALGIRFVQGLLVAGVEEDSPADEAGFRRGIVITHIAGEEYHSADRLAELLADIAKGDRVRMAVVISERRRNIVYQQATSVALQAR